MINDIHKYYNYYAILHAWRVMFEIPQKGEAFFSKHRN